VNRAELADFLRRRRAVIQPADVGLPAGLRRRTPGLRREEVARLAGMSVDYYNRLEQSRGPRPSRQVLAALARALRLDDDGRDHLYRLAGEPPPEATRPTSHVRPGVLLILDKLDDVPALVVNARGDVLAWNALAAALITDFSALPPERRNFTWLHFSPPPGWRGRLTGDQAERDRLGREHVADLRALAAQYPDDTDLARMIAELREASPRFAAMWERHDVAVRRIARKRIDHPVVGPLDLECEVLFTPEHDQRLIMYTAPPGSPTAEALALLRVVGLQDTSQAAGTTG
jgi:transcriptional regulator with XRE-family HTH domain